MLSLNLKEFSRLAKLGMLMPLYDEFPADADTPVSAFLKIKKGKYGFLLESAEGGEKWGRYSFLGTEPLEVISFRDGVLERVRGAKKIEKSKPSDPLGAVQEILSEYKPVAVKGLPPFFGGAVGFFSYDMARHIEKIPATAKNDLGMRDFYFFIVGTVVIFDNVRQVIQVVTNIKIDGTKHSVLYERAKKNIEEIKRRLSRPLTNKLKSIVPLGDKARELKANRSEAQYIKLVERAKEYIRAGDIFQVQVSVRFEGKTKVKPFDLYRTIRRVNPSPYLYYLHFPDMALVGASPELMVRLKNGRVEYRPIAGTRRRGHDEVEDKQLEEELKSDPKERAEHVMLVDLGRNDLGRVCKTGSVTVDEIETVERYSHVMHLVSHVSGELKDDKTPYDLIRATFPAGTLTGAPKIRAMEIIEELEGTRRGIYGGAVGYLSFDGNLDMAIAIRTALFYKKSIFIQAAGGIVYDSVPKLEYKEAHNKARALLKALVNVEGRKKKR